MTPRENDEHQLRAYLLGRLAPEQRDELDDRLLSDDALFWQRLSLTEDDLVDQYVCGSLGDSDTENFEDRYLCTDARRAKVQFARALHAFLERDSASGVPEPSIVAREREPAQLWFARPVAAPAWAAAAAVFLLLAAPAAVWRYAQPATGGRTSAGAAVVTSATLSPGLTRAAGAELERIRINSDTLVVRLALDVGDESYDEYRVTLHDVDGNQLLAFDGVVPSSFEGGLRATVAVPAESLPEGDYFVWLHGRSAAGSTAVINRYDFRLLRD